MDFKVGDKVALHIGGEAEVIEKLGEGGQGAVYRVRYNGKEYALKWYLKSQEKEFYENLKSNIEKGSPADSFLWPLFLTEKKGETFGYIMNLRPKEYNDFSYFLLAKVNFKNAAAIISAGINMCSGFRALHNKGYSYQDLNDGNFFINPQNGAVLICDNDNVAPYGTNTGIAGKCRYMAPEVVGGSRPNTQSDRYSLAVLLFLLLFNNHPLEGKKITSFPCLTEKHEKRLYGKEAVFIYDPTDTSNRPVNGIHSNVIRLWNAYPKYVQEMFTKAFGHEVLNDPNKRIIEKEWISVFLRLRNELIKCPCGEDIFLNPDEPKYTCPECGKTYNRPPVLKVGKYKNLLVEHKSVHEYLTKEDSENYTLVVGSVVASTKNPGLFGLRNKTGDMWILTLKDGSQRAIAKDEVAPLLTGNKINFGTGTEGEIL